VAGTAIEDTGAAPTEESEPPAGDIEAGQSTADAGAQPDEETAPAPAGPQRRGWWQRRSEA